MLGAPRQRWLRQGELCRRVEGGSRANKPFEGWNEAVLLAELLTRGLPVGSRLLSSTEPAIAQQLLLPADGIIELWFVGCKVVLATQLGELAARFVG